MIGKLRDTIIDYELRRFADPTTANPSSLEQYIVEAEQDLKGPQMEAGAVHNAFALYLRLENSQRRLEILQSYLTNDLSVLEEAWARWNIVDALALMRKSDELVSTHKAFLLWARKTLDQNMLFWVMEDRTQALGWFLGGHGDDWIEILHDLNKNIAASAHNRYHRFQCYRSASEALSKFDRNQEAIDAANSILNITREDSTWPYSLYAEMAGYTAFAKTYAASGNTAQLHAVVLTATQRLKDFKADLPKPETLGEIRPPLPDQIHTADCLGRYFKCPQQVDPVIAYRGACHNFGTALYCAKMHELALPFFEQAMAYKYLSPYLARCYAGSLWTVTKDMQKLSSFIQKANPVFGHKEDWWRGVPELKNIENI